MSHGRNRRIRARHETPEINITAFMNLMVVLIPFLLLTAAFNQLTILEVYLPQIGAPSAEAKEKKPELELVLRADSVTLQDRRARKTYQILKPNTAGELDFNALQPELKKLKTQHPELTTITLLSEDGIPYERLIQAMDHVRAVNETQGGKLVSVELFPDIALGDAPDTAKGKNGKPRAGS